MILTVWFAMFLTAFAGEGNRDIDSVTDKFSLWTGKTQLRGANIWQAIVIPDLDGPDFKGPGPVGPPYTQNDFDRLAEWGANYVNISHPGLFTKTSPFTLNPNIQAYLDNLLTKIANADMFAVISFRTGPGRSEFSLCCDVEPENEKYFNDTMWRSQAAQNAWVAMWRYTANRYRENPIVVGYDLMVEPNSNAVGSNARDPLDIWDSDEFYDNYGGTLLDWNQLYPRITRAIREMDSKTPILIGGMSYSAIAWMPYLKPTGDPRTVYMAHQYEPQDDYTHQNPPLINTYPGVFDIDGDGVDDQFNRAWLNNLLSTVDTFAATHGVRVAVNEFGLIRWEPGAARYMDDLISLFEQRGMNHALWEWQTSWAPFAMEVHDMNFRLGPDPNNRTDVASSSLIKVIKKYWGRNTIRPSNASFAQQQE